MTLKSKSGCKSCPHHRASPESISCKTDLGLFCNMYPMKRISQSSWLDYILLQTQNNLQICRARASLEQGRSRKRRLPLSRKSPLLIAADDQWWRKQAALIDFGQIEMFGAFWLLRLGCRKIGSGLLLSRAGSLNGLWIKTVAASICVKISALYYTLLILPTPHIEQ